MSYIAKRDREWRARHKKRQQAPRKTSPYFPYILTIPATIIGTIMFLGGFYSAMARSAPIPSLAEGIFMLLGMGLAIVGFVISVLAAMIMGVSKKRHGRDI
jgi:hypothetical protein